MIAGTEMHAVDADGCDPFLSCRQIERIFKRRKCTAGRRERKRRSRIKRNRTGAESSVRAECQRWTAKEQPELRLLCRANSTHSGINLLRNGNAESMLAALYHLHMRIRKDRCQEFRVVRTDNPV